MVSAVMPIRVSCVLLCSIFGWVLMAASVSAQGGTPDGAVDETQDEWQDEAHRQLMKMNRAFSDLAYDGVFSYFSGDELASLRIVHKVMDGVQRERLVHLNGAPREIVRHGEEVACIVMPGDDLLALEQSIPAGPFARAFVRQFERIDSSYSVDEFGEGRVAGRIAQRIGVSPKDEHRYGYRLWLDRETALLLRSELVDQEGNKLEIFQFTNVKIGDEVDAGALEPEEKSGSKVSHLRLEQSDPLQPIVSKHTSLWRTNWLPPGFEMASTDVRRAPLSGQAIDSLMYSDGLSAFSIFIEPMPKGGASSMVSQTGATVAMTHHVASGSDHYLVTLVGEIPPPTARSIIQSVAKISG
jgi:sigma-E factor negative regulatory protein RseB